MSKIDNEYVKDLYFFYITLALIPALDKIPLTKLRVSDIHILQQLSKAANHDGICILLGVDIYYRNLISLHVLADLKSKPKLSFAESPDSAIYIGNSVSPRLVVKVLRRMSRRYKALKPLSYQTYEGGDDFVPKDELIRGNAMMKYKHELFMYDHDMHHTLIPADYK